MSRLWIAVAVIVLATGGLWASKARTPKVDADRIRAHVKYLASDELEGRGTGRCRKPYSFSLRRTARKSP